MSINLLGMATQALGGDFAQKAGQFMGETEGSAQSAMAGILPALLGTIAQKGSSADGAAGILSMLTGPNVNSGLLGNIGALLTPGSAQAGPVMQAGTAILGSLFGDKLGGLAGTVASMSGLKAGNVSSLLQMVAPLVMGVLAKHVSSNNINAGGLQSLLQGQQAGLASALDPRLGSLLGMAGLASSVLGAGAAKVSDAVGAATGAMGAATGALGAAASGALGSASGALGGAANTASGALGAATGALGAAGSAASGALAGGVGRAAGAAGALGGAASGALGGAAGAAAGMAKAGGGGLMRWLPWLIGAAILIWLFKSCMGPTQKAAEVPATPTAPAATAPAKPAEPPKAVEAAKPVEPAKSAQAPAAKPAPAAVVSMPPMVKVYFDSGKAVPSAQSMDALVPIVKYVKANAGSKIRLAGFHDKTGSQAANETLAKNRAQGIASQLGQAGIPESRIVFDNPSQTVGGGEDREARRVEVSIAQ
jgi:outer membrane protein OmpA-like peptidoglycan-associated protein